ncbi:MAG: FMN-binding glutamate synthase family protein [Deltaproteobacteria bacterium]|nr:FMN-binding glutamate synthase family protein [Deltaproteobacteria bacterium]
MLFWFLMPLGGILLAVVLHDVFQSRHAILHNFPIIGHFRYWIEAIGPELRQYVVTNNDEERPFSRDQRRWVYTSSKQANNLFGFGSDNDLEAESNYLVIKHSAFPLEDPLPGTPQYDSKYRLPCAKVLGAPRGRAKAFRPGSIVNISAMSFGSLSSNAIMALNDGAKLAGCMHNTGEGGLSPYHQRGADLIWQMGTGYFGARSPEGRFSREILKEKAAAHNVKAIEIKLSQGAKPGKGGILPAAKVSREISLIRGVPQGKDCISPSTHTEFHDADSLLDFVEGIAEATGLPVGIKSAVGELSFWHDLVRLMEGGKRGVDFITIDGGEGGTGAAPLVFSDHVSLPFKLGMSRVYSLFAERGLTGRIVFIGSGRLGFPEQALLAFQLGCDMINVAREAMLAIGCIQAQKCHTDHCPTGVATQNRWLAAGLDPRVKSVRVANYLMVLRKEILQLSRACGVPHPTLLPPDRLEILDGQFGGAPVKEKFGYHHDWGYPTPADQEMIREVMAGLKASGNAGGH